MNQSKTCSRCLETKPLEDFYRSKGKRMGRASMCKSCDSAKGKAYYCANRERVSQKHREYRCRNREAVKSRAAKYYQDHKQAIKEKREGEKDARRAYDLAYYRKNKPAIIASKSVSSRERYKSDPGFALVKRTRWMVRDCLRSGASGCFRNLPYTKDELVEHLLSTLPDGYTAEDALDGNKLHIDHIRPISSYNLTGEIDADFLDCWSLENLRLLPAAENISKGNKWEGWSE